MLWAKAVRSPVHHAGIKGVDYSKAQAMKGVHAIVTWEDVPRLVYGHLEALGIPGDEPLLAKDELRYKGQPIALIAAESEEIAQAAVEAVELDLEERPALFDIRKAADPDAPQVHHWGNWYPHFEAEMDVRQIRKGDIDAAFDAADTIVTGVYRPAAIEHVPDGAADGARRPRAERPADDLLVHAGALLLDGRRRRAPGAAAEQVQGRRRDGRRRLRRQGGHRDRDDLRARRDQGRPAR